MSAVLPFRTRAEVDAEVRGYDHRSPLVGVPAAGRRGQEIVHGTNLGYGEGCRCSACLHARREYLRTRGGDRHHDLRASD